MALNLYVNTSIGTLLTSLSNWQGVNAMMLPFFYGDDYLPLNVFLMEPDGNGGYIPTPTSGISLEVALAQGTVGGTQYTVNAAWTADSTGTYFQGNLPMATAALQALLGGATSAPAWLQISQTIEGYRNTVLALQTSIGVGIASGGLVAPQGYIPLSVQAAQQMFFPIIGAAGEALTVTSPSGKMLQLRAVDNPDGTATAQWNAIN
jgi:hypothetical protein